MYVRFVILQPDEQSHAPQGVFHAAFDLRDSAVLESYERDWLDREMGWLQEHLHSPKILREAGNHRALSWFDPRALRPIQKVRSICMILQEHGTSVRMLKTRDPGLIIYRDGWQVVAKPHRKSHKRHRLRAARQRCFA